HALEEEGFPVWWDKVLSAGQTYDEVTEGMLRDAAVVVVLWSQTSVKSKWVRAEATVGERSSAIVPAMIEDAERPILFELTQTADLIGWDGDRTDERWRTFVEDIRRAYDARNADPEKAASSSAAQATDPDATIETAFWNSIKDGGDADEFKAYLDRYPKGHFVSLAENRLKALAAPVQPTTPPPPPPPPPPRTAPTQQTTSPTPTKKSGSGGLIALGGVALIALAGAAIFALGGVPGGLGGLTLENAEDTAPSSFKDCDTCPEMTPLSAATFLLGSPESEPGREGIEGPQQSLDMPAFAISRTEITVAQWKACEAAEVCRDAPVGEDPDLPATRVTFNDALDYARWLSSTTGRAYRLPSEAEWEFAARGGTETAYWWGDTFDVNQVPRQGPAAPGTLTANPYGLRGMLGNVREWTADCYNRSHEGAPANGVARQSGDCGRRVVRGADWRGDAGVHRAANRASFSSGTLDRGLGFRVVTSNLSVE
ncbi:MAG: SUMF1/EgtB/PvdO family nonheme iron enzyme, partial [Pseudomonadota bacterium]